ncbi:GFA family protein [Pseudomonas sp. 15FMM2]|uniref:GFA family protein n=1 Tax=Pseudomonas imrae TaxID=2992837 RepID=A0ACC7PE40_9PSED
MTDTLLGSCLCGAVKYQLSAPLQAVSHCHCSQCRKSHGAAFASYASVRRTDLHLLQGADRLMSYPSSEGILRQFCGQCGSSLFWSNRLGDYPDWISIALGTLDTTVTLPWQKHVYVESKASWYALQDDRPQGQ